MITDRIVDRIVQLEVMLMFMIFNADQARVVADFEGAVQCTSELIHKFASLALGIESTILAEERTDFPLTFELKKKAAFSCQRKLQAKCMQ